MEARDILLRPHPAPPARYGEIHRDDGGRQVCVRG